MNNTIFIFLTETKFKKNEKNKNNKYCYSDFPSSIHLIGTLTSLQNTSDRISENQKSVIFLQIEICPLK